MQNSGFTMIELVLVLLILSVLAAVTFPRLSPSLRKTRMEEAASGFAAIIIQARSEAVWRSSTTKLVFSSNAHEYSFERQLAPNQEPQARAESGMDLFHNPPPLPESIKVVRLEHDERATAVVPILFKPSGINDPVDIVLADTGGNIARIHCGTWVDDVSIQFK